MALKTVRTCDNCRADGAIPVCSHFDLCPGCTAQFEIFFLNLLKHLEEAPRPTIQKPSDSYRKWLDGFRGYPILPFREMTPEEDAAYNKFIERQSTPDKEVY